MTSTPDNLIPEEYHRWPRAIQRHYIEELYFLYLGERIHLPDDDTDTTGQAATPKNR